MTRSMAGTTWHKGMFVGCDCGFFDADQFFRLRSVLPSHSKESAMLTFVGAHFVDLVIVGVSAFSLVLLGVSVDDAFRAHRP